MVQILCKYVLTFQDREQNDNHIDQISSSWNVTVQQKVTPRVTKGSYAFQGIIKMGALYDIGRGGVVEYKKDHILITFIYIVYLKAAQSGHT